MSHKNKNKEIGLTGEKLAFDYLIRKGYVVLERNYRSGRGEVDLIARENDTLVFVEVKTRRNLDFGFPEESVDEKKQEKIMDCADQYIHEVEWKGNIRFDIISILLNSKSTPVLHLEDVF